MTSPTHSRELPPRLLIAVGGNAIHPQGIKGTPEEQMDTAARAAQTLLPILELERELIVTHGNGPGVAKTMMRQALARPARRRALPLARSLRHPRISSSHRGPAT